MKPGRVLTVCAGEVYALIDGAQKAVAAMLGTMVARPGIPEMPARQ